MGRVLWQALGLACIGAGAVGALLPLIPTTPFLLVAAFAFARSSPRLHEWLISHRQFGPLINNWRQYGAIDTRSKITAIVVMVAALAITAIAQAPLHILLIQAGVLSASALFILTRPTAPRH